MREEVAGSGTRSFRVAVVGGGISGLSTAWYVERLAAAQGMTVTCSVYETADRWGGRILTEVVERAEGRFVVEGGPDSFLTTQKPWAVDLALELGLGERLLGTNDAARKVYVLSKGKPVPMPDGVFLLVPTKFKPFIFSPLISPLGKLRMGLDVFIPRRKSESDETLGSFVTRRLGSEALDKIAEPLLSGIYNAEAQRQSLLATFPRFRDTELAHGSLIRGMLADKARARRARKTQAVPGHSGSNNSGAQGAKQSGGRPRSMFSSFVDGTGEIISGLTSELGAELVAGVRVTGISAGEQDDYLLQIVGREGRPAHTIHADAVVLAIPAYDAAGLLAPFSEEVGALLRAIRYVSTGTISLAFEQDASAGRFGGFGVVVPTSEKRPLNAITWSSTKFDHRAPRGHSLVRVFFGGSRSPGTMQLDDAELLSVIKRELRSTMGIAREPLFHRIYRWDMANPQYDVEHLKRVEAIERSLPPGVFVTGSAYRGVGLPDCVRQSHTAAEQVIERLADLQRS